MLEITIRNPISKDQLDVVIEDKHVIVKPKKYLNIYFTDGLVALRDLVVKGFSKHTCLKSFETYGKKSIFYLISKSLALISKEHHTSTSTLRKKLSLYTGDSRSIIQNYKKSILYVGNHYDCEYMMDLYKIISSIHVVKRIPLHRKLPLYHVNDYYSRIMTLIDPKEISEHSKFLGLDISIDIRTIIVKAKSSEDLIYYNYLINLLYADKLNKNILIIKEIYNSPKAVLFLELMNKKFPNIKLLGVSSQDEICTHYVCEITKTIRENSAEVSTVIA